jgi:hypothetical protein
MDGQVASRMCRGEYGKMGRPSRDRVFALDRGIRSMDHRQYRRSLAGVVYSIDFFSKFSKIPVGINAAKTSGGIGNLRHLSGIKCFIDGRLLNKISETEEIVRVATGCLHVLLSYYCCTTCHTVVTTTMSTCQDLLYPMYSATVSINKR